MHSAKGYAFVAMVLLVAVLAGCGGTQTSQPGASQGSSQPPAGGSIQAVQHVVIMVQENRSFDHYFGFLNDYRVSQGLAADVDGMPANAQNIGYKGIMVNA